jgi:lysosomal alpha-mannosidase
VIHVVPHSHDDLGWTRTIDQYWRERVKSIYDNLTVTLAGEKNSNRTFTIDGIDFLMMWWKHQNDTIREYTKGLI